MGRLSRAMRAETEVVSKPKEVRAGEGFRENVGDVVAGSNPRDGEFFVGNEFSDGVVLYSNMFDLRMPHMVFSQATRGVVVAV
jgi:hypothetical protein